MANSTGVGFPTVGIQKGHIFHDLDDGATYIFINGDPRVSSSWRLLNGVFPTNPETSTWGNAQRGAMWFNAAEETLKTWDGTQVVAIGGGGGGGSSAIIRMTAQMNGTEMSIGFGGPCEKFIIMPVAGTLVKWGIVVGDFAIPQDLTCRIVGNPLGVSSTLDQVALLTGALLSRTDRVIAAAVAAEDPIMFYIPTVVSPAVHTLNLMFYADLQPA